MRDLIWKGDKVNIFFENCDCLFGLEVLYNCAEMETGIWVLKRLKDNKIFYVKNYCYMVKIEDKKL